MHWSWQTLRQVCEIFAASGDGRNSFAVARIIGHPISAAEKADFRAA
jgi:hypothetical protein